MRVLASFLLASSLLGVVSCADQRAEPQRSQGPTATAPAVASVPPARDGARLTAATIPISAGPTMPHAIGGAIWIVRHRQGELVRVDPRTDQVTDRIKIPGSGPYTGAAVQVTGSVLAMARGHVIAIVDVARRHVVAVPRPEKAFASPAAGDGQLWDARPIEGGTVVERLDLRTGAVVDRLAGLPIGVQVVAVGGGSLWLDDQEGTVLRVSERTRRVVARLHPGVQVIGAAFTRGTLWLGTAGLGRTARIDLATNRVTEIIPLGGNLAVGADALWLGEMTSNRIARVDLRTGRITGVWHVGLAPRGIDPRRDPINAGLVVTDGNLWAANWAAGRLLRLRLPDG